MIEHQADYDPFSLRVNTSSSGTASGHLRGQKKSPDQTTSESTANAVAAGQLRAFIERIERLEEEKKTIGDDIKEVFAELKGTGFDTKAVRVIIRMRKKELHELQEEQAMIELYCDALGMPLYGGA